MAKKGSKNAPGVPEIWEEVKKRYNVALTPKAVAGLDDLAKQAGLSRSELVERIGRELIPVALDFEEEDIPKLKKLAEQNGEPIFSLVSGWIYERLTAAE
jgi:hypothetical protein